MRPTTVAAEAHGRRGIGQPHLDLERTGDGIRLGSDFPDAPGRRHGRVVLQRHGDLRVLRRRSGSPGRARRRRRPCAPWRASVTIIRPADTTSPGSAPTEVMTPAASALSSVKAIWSSANLTCASADSTWDCAVWNDSRAWSSSACETAPRAARGSWRRRLLRALVSCPCAADRAARAERRAFCSFCGSRRAISWPGSDPVAVVDASLDHAARDPERERSLVLRADGAGEHDRHARVPLRDRHRAHRADLRCDRSGLLPAGGRDHHQGDRQSAHRRWEPAGQLQRQVANTHCQALLPFCLGSKLRVAQDRA